MTKIQRNTQKIFGSNAPADDIAVLGSFKTGTPVYTDNVADLQNAAYEEGYGAALVANEAPFMEEQNSVPYVITKQLAYLFQEGIPEYDAGTTYYIGSIVKNLEDNKVILYQSITDDNTGNALTDTANWEKVELGGGGSGTGGFNLFDIITTDHILEGDEAVGKELLGTYVYKSAIAGGKIGYPEFYNKCIEEYNAGEDSFITGEDIKLSNFTSNTQNGITISDSKGNTTNLQTLFNNGTAGITSSVIIGSWSTYWIDIDYGKPTYLQQYKIGADNSSTAEHPADWTLQASNDGENFDILGTYTNQDFDLGQIKTYKEGVSYNQTKPYKQYRLVFSAGVETSKGGELGSVRFYAKEVIPAKKNSNGHIFYDIADKAFIDEIYEKTGLAWYYGVDTENERIFLPRGQYQLLYGYTLPVKVFGTGKTLGMTNGTSNVGLWPNNGLSGSPLDADTAAFNVPVSDTSSTGGRITKGNLGVVTDPETSGLKGAVDFSASSFKGYAYMVVGNTSTVTKLTTNIADDEVLEQINKNSADILNKVDKSEAANICVPDYTAGITITSGFTAPDNGVICSTSSALTNKTATLLINNVKVGSTHGGSITQDNIPFYAIVGKGDVVTYTNMYEAYFFPMKGVN